MIHVLATIDVSPGQRSEFLAAFGAIVPEVLAESGCIEYGAAVDHPVAIERQPAARESTVIVVEKWESVAALKDHLAAPHMLRFRESIKHLVTGTEIRVLDPA